jgi:hypothetical protein
LETSGFSVWLAEDCPAEVSACLKQAELERATPEQTTPEQARQDQKKKHEEGTPETATLSEHLEFHEMERSAELHFTVTSGWRPWNRVSLDEVVPLTAQKDLFAFGIGSSAATPEEAQPLFGEFVSVSGMSVYQPAEEQSPPDWLVSEGDFVPVLQTIQSLVMQGDFRTLMRFAPGEDQRSFSLSQLLKQVVNKHIGQAVGYVMLAEIEGLTGSSLIQSPALRESEGPVGFPEIRDWISFCGERLYSGQQALVVGIVCENETTPVAQWATPSETVDGISLHAHAAVFPYQPLQTGKIDLTASVEKFFAGEPPLAVMHLLDDQRPVIGLGESSFIRGACWFTPLAMSGGTK